MQLAVIDLETTGVSPASDRIVEIGIVRTTGFAESERWSSLVRADVPVGASEHIHGISDAMLEGAPTLASLRERIEVLTEGATIVAHRAAFDLAFLDAATLRGELGPRTTRVIDTAAVAERALGESSLRAIARRVGGRAPSHRALPDALAALDALAACAATLGPIDADELSALGHPRASMRAEVERVLRTGSAGIVYRPASGRAHEDVLRVETIAPPYVTGILEKKGIRRLLRGDRIVRAWHGPRPSIPFF